MKKTSLIIIALTLFTSMAQAVNLPVIPEGEVIRYRTLIGKKGDDIEYTSQSIYHINEEGKDLFLIKSHSDDQSTETRMTMDSFIPISMSQRLYGGRSEVSTTTSLLSVPGLNSNEIALLDMGDLAHVLRAYPFDDPRDMELVFLGLGEQEMSSMSFRVVFEGEETIEMNDTTYDAWKLQMKADLSGAMAIFGAMIPKTYMWFSREESRHLLKMTGSRGPGSDNAITLEMISYTR